MELKQIIERLQSTLDNLIALEESQFYYKSFVSKFDKTHNCPTVACVAGYYPIWYPKSNLEYLEIQGIVHLSICGGATIGSIKKALMDYHGLSDCLISVLFFGKNIEYVNVKGDINRIHADKAATLEEVILRFQTVIESLSDGSITPNYPSISEV